MLISVLEQIDKSNFWKLFGLYISYWILFSLPTPVNFSYFKITKEEFWGILFVVFNKLSQSFKLMTDI